jgi:hypothetical protein
MNERKQILYRIIKTKGDCIGEVCAICPLYPDCGFDMWNNSEHYKKAVEIYAEEFGEIEMIEDLL